MGNERKALDDKVFGPISYENWKAKNEGKQIKYAFEYPLFTDTHITGEITQGCGPYQFLNTVPIFKQGTIAPSIILRVNEYLEEDPTARKMSKTDTERYHGGWLVDEVAALISLCLGIRLKAGGCIRNIRDVPRIYGLHVGIDLIQE